MPIPKISQGAPPWDTDKNMLRIEALRNDHVFYLSGPMAGYDDHNKASFARAKLLLQGSPYNLTVVSPADLTPPNDDPQPRDYLWTDLAVMLDQCSGIIMLDGWVHSEGARLEFSIAAALHWPIFYYEEELNEVIDINGMAVVS